MKAGSKPSLATTTAKASDRVIADPLGLDDVREGFGIRAVSPAAELTERRAAS